MDAKTDKSDERISSYTRLLNQAEVGHLDNLECPGCGNHAVKVWYTNPVENTYRTWFICSDCDFHTRAQNIARPQFFAEDRVNKELEERDLLILKRSRFKQPPQQLI